jgi:PAS domain S-box-containing protein
VRPTVSPYAVAVLALAGAVLLRWLLDPLMGDSLPLVTLFGAVAGAVWVGGFRPALLVTSVGYLACHYLFIQPRGTLRFGTADAVGLVAYIFTCALIVAIGEAMRYAQAAANTRGELLRVTLGSIGDAVITTDMHGRVTYLNPVAESLTGWTQQDALGKPLEAVFRIIKEETRDTVESPATRALRDGIVVGLANHTLLVTKDGVERPIDDSAAPIRDERGVVSGCVLIFRDVSERRQWERREAARLTSARLLASIVESSDDAIISKSLGGIIQSWNVAAERLFGYTSEEAVGRHISLIIPPDRLAEEDHIIATLRAGTRIDHFETERVRKDGRPVSVSLTVSPIRDDDGNIVGASKIARDVTERRQMEDNLRKLAADLAEADRRKDEFLATLAHELRNPLAPLSNTLEILKRLGSSDPATRRGLDTMERQLEQLVRLVDDLLDLSRITHNRIELRKRHIELAPLIRQAVLGAQPLAHSASHAIEVSLPSEPLWLNADAVRLTQVFGNLLNNSCKYTPAGGRIRVIAQRDGTDAVVTVSDAGIGIPADKLAAIFDMFTQIDHSLEQSQGGLGIGLTLVKRLVEMHGGSVEARSDGVGQGSAFVVRLPIAIDVSEVSAPEPSESLENGATHRILVVDDNKDSADSLAMLLQLTGHEVFVAHDGHSALVAVELRRPDVVLLDIGLPSLNGHDVCRWIRQQPWGKTTVIIALTGWGQEEDRRRSQEAGFDGHLVKPVDHGHLLALLESLIRPKAT